MDNLEIDYKKAAQQLRSGETLFGKGRSISSIVSVFSTQLSKVRWTLI